MLEIISTILRKQNEFFTHLFFFAFRRQVLYSKYNISFHHDSFISTRVENFLINHRFSPGNSRLMFPSRERGNNNLSLRLANRANSFVL